MVKQQQQEEEEEMIQLDNNKLKNHGIPLEHFDFKFVDKCENVKELEKIYKVLVSGIEGKYPDLENFVYEKIKRLSPNSRTLRKDLPIAHKNSISKSDKEKIDEEIDNFVQSLSSISPLTTTTATTTTTTTAKTNGLLNQFESDFKTNEENLPPVRNFSKTLITENKNSTNLTKKTEKVKVAEPESATSVKNVKKSPKPKDYREWQKIENQLDADENEEDKSTKDSSNTKQTLNVVENKTQINQTNNVIKASIKDLPKNVETEVLNDNLKQIKAEQEKNKGNEAFNAGSYEEALIYYTRSLQFLPNASSYNNRAMTYLKLEDWNKAIEDCDEVLKFEVENVKALLRRATAYLKKNKFNEAKNDIDKCLGIEPNNKKGLELKTQIESAIKKQNEDKEKLLNENKSRGGNRVRIEETDGSDSEEEEEQQQQQLQQPQQKQEVKKPEIKPVELEKSDKKETYSENKISKSNVETTKLNAEKTTTLEPNKTNHSTITTSQVTSYDKNTNHNNKQNGTLESNLKPNDKIHRIAQNFDEVLKYKDEAYKLFLNGNYADALEFYSKAIDSLNKSLINKSTQDTELYYKNMLVVLYNNKASCSQRICDYKSCISSCDSGLDLIKSIDDTNEDSIAPELKSLRVKLIEKKAHCLEMLEKYTSSFLEYEKLMKLDSSYKNVQQSYNRLKNILNESGELKKLRLAANQSNTVAAELPKLEDSKENSNELKIDSSQTKDSLTKNLDKAEKHKEAKEAQKHKDEEEKKQKIQKLYEEYKTKGNEYVKLNDFKQACDLYTKCVELDNVNILAYLNRSLCYIKLDEPDLAIKDSTYVLENDKNNVKALYRRATANKMKLKYDLVEKDLKHLLSIEPNNQIAIKEYESIKTILDKSNKTNISNTNGPILNKIETPQIKSDKLQDANNNDNNSQQTLNRKKVLIKELDNEIIKPNVKEEIQIKPKISESREQINGMAAANNKQNESKQIDSTKPTKTFSFTKISNPYEFLQAWNSINPKDFNTYTILISRIDPTNLPKLIGTKLDDDMLTKFIKSIHLLKFNKELNESICGNDDEKIGSYLIHLAKTQRFNVTKLFIDKQEKILLKEILDSINSVKIDKNQIREIYDL